MSSPTHLTLRLLKLPTRSTLGAAHNRHERSQGSRGHRLITIVGLHLDNELGEVAGWGECAALNTAGYTPESAEGAFDLLRSGRPFDRTTAPMATAAIEMALLDSELKAAGQSLAERLGTANAKVPAGAVVGLAPIPTMLDEVEELAAAGYGRIKLKIAPGRIVVPVKTVRTSFPELELHVDANASLRADDMPMLLELRDLGVRVVEQPFAVADNPSAARLIAESDLVVAADESIRGPADIDTLAADRAATAAVVKPSKLGGIRVALELLDRVDRAGMQASIGGMLETGLGRHVLAALAPLPVFTVTGDLSPAKRWLADDPFRDIAMRRGMITAPSRPGIAGDPMQNRLDRYTIRQALVVAKTAVSAVERIDGQPS